GTVFPIIPAGNGIAAVQPGQLGNVALFNNFGGGFGNGFGNGRDGNDFFGTVRVRVGYAFDRLLIYATGGFAWTGGNNRNNDGFFGGFGGGFANGAAVVATS